MISDKAIETEQNLIADFISNRRKERGLSQGALAEKAGVSRRTISRLENNEVMPGIDNFLKVCHALDCFFFLAEKDSKEDFVQAFRKRWDRPHEDN